MATVYQTMEDLTVNCKFSRTSDDAVFQFAVTSNESYDVDVLKAIHMREADDNMDVAELHAADRKVKENPNHNSAILKSETYFMFTVIEAMDNLPAMLPLPAQRRRSDVIVACCVCKIDCVAPPATRERMHYIENDRRTNPEVASMADHDRGREGGVQDPV